MKNKHLYLMPALTGVLLWLAWPPFHTSPILFFALIPLLLFDYESRQRGFRNKHYWFGILSGLFVWNALTTWWVWNATEGGAIAMLILNSIFMSLPFLLHHHIWKLSTGRFSWAPLVILYTAFEHFHHNWDISWPWLTLGNAFASTPNLVQWFEYSGTLGGSLWVWIVNLSLLMVILRSNWKRLWLPAILIAFPILLSLLIKVPEVDGGRSVRAVIVQPNIDPYEEKFEKGSRHMTPEQQLDKILALAESKINEKTELLIFPETSITDGIPEEGEYWKDNHATRRLREFVRQHPKIKILSGADTYMAYHSKNEATSTAHKFSEKLWVDFYNSAVLLDSNSIEIYHKSKLVPGVELMPYPSVLGVINLGGIAGNLGRQDESEVFTANGVKLAPVICYESIYGDYVTSYIRKGAEAIVIMTNDGWWGNTPGYRQHLEYARLRAIETRRPILRSANTGISGFIDSKGNVSQTRGWWIADAIEVDFIPSNTISFYVKHGDLIGPAALWMSLVLVLYFIWMIVQKRRTSLRSEL